MFGFNHPQAPSRRAVAMQIVEQRRQDADAHRLLVAPPGGDVALPPAGEALVFDVVYTLPEYLGIVRDHLAFTLRRHYLLLVGRGGLPIPYRCLDRQQQAALRRFARAPGRRA